MKVPISVLIPAKNEEDNIAQCLQSVEWADEVLVVDSQSADRTADIACEMGATVIQFHYQGRGPKKKNWALGTLPFRNDWILIVDADERITDPLRDEIIDAIKSETIAGYYLNRKYYFLGRWIKHCGWYPSWNLRLFKHKLGRYEIFPQGAGDDRVGDNEVHEHVILKGDSQYLKNDMLHTENKDLFVWMEKHNRYSTWEAAVAGDLILDRTGSRVRARLFGNPEEIKRRLRQIFLRLPCKSALRFLYMYVIRFGFLDGVAGYYFCRLHAAHQLVIAAKRYERQMVLTERTGAQQKASGPWNE